MLKSVLLYSAVCFAASATGVRSLVTLPLQFEENQKQTAGHVRYLLRGGGVAGFFTDEAALFRLGGSTGASTVRVELVGRREGVSPRGEDRAASFTAPVAPASIATVYIEGADYPYAFPGEGPAPTTLGGLSFKLIDSAKAQFSPQLFFVGANQNNLYIDDAAALGEATLNVFERSELVGAGTIQISRIAPGVFFVGNRIAAAFSLTVNPDNSRVQVETFDATLAPRPIDLGPEGTGVYLLLFGSGIHAGAGNVTVTVGGE